MTRQRTRLLAVLLGTLAALGLVGLGRATAADPATAKASGYHDGALAGYADGFRDGHAEGLQEGRALAVTAALPPGTRDRAKAAFDAGYRAGANGAFAGYDGGWSLGEPYVIVLAKGGNGVTYRIASRTPVPGGLERHRRRFPTDHQVAGLSDRTVTSSGLPHRPHGPVV